ncbi:plant cysteine oxidase 3 isoform X2 [Quercus lobata]|uniref:cysteine dioxygenase n=1 Tax=Quercus lobata TaxID=97700 RepID=A0A7N2MSI0_QUELO|nr:plant cysteine oxidase 3 isoform X2 [Quercus lobata]
MLSKFHKASDKARRFLQNKATLFVRNLTMTKNTSKVQALYDLCNTTFTPSPSGASPPSSQAIQRLCSLLDTFGPADVGLKEELSDDDRGHGIFGLNQLNRIARWAQPITYLDVYECDSFTMCIFCFPTSAVIPLHDHPEMTVFSKVLYGSMHVKAYDWVEPAQIQERKGPSSFPVRLAKLSVDKVLTAPCGTTVLYPKSGGNLHCFTAVTPCAILDILSPPYKEEAGRKCSYYHDYPYSTFSAGNGSFVRNGKEEDYAWLEQIETPDDLYMRQGKYAGPAIQF